MTYLTVHVPLLLAVASLLVLGASREVNAFVATPRLRAPARRCPARFVDVASRSPPLLRRPPALLSMGGNEGTAPVDGSTRTKESDDDAEIIGEIRAMRVKQLKDELKALGIGTEDAFEKDELVKRLFNAWKDRKDVTKNGQPQQTGRSDGSSSGSTKSNSSSASVIEAPLSFYTLENFKSVDAENAAVYVRPSPGKFAALRIDLPSLSGTGKSLSLLVDTACSGVVLRPSVVQRLGIRTLSATGSMAAAGGNIGNTQVAQLDRFDVCGNSFGPMPAAVQDIGALPSLLDGIIGLSFLNQFACVEMDYRNGKLILNRRDENPPTPNGLHVVAEGRLVMTRIAVWIADVSLDGRGPVKMLVDTGAASTLLNWKGVADMGLSRDSSVIERNANELGAIGADNVALRLTHRYNLKRRFNFAGEAGTSQPGVDTGGRTVNIDVGDIPVLEILKNEGVGGILGADLLMLCDVVRMSGVSGRITLLK